jgi:hypothetical protein
VVVTYTTHLDIDKKAAFYSPMKFLPVSYDSQDIYFSQLIGLCIEGEAISVKQHLGF